MGVPTSDKRHSSPSGITRAYLFFFNLLSCSLWLTSLILAISFLTENRSVIGFYDHARSWVQLAQGMAILEIVHPLLGLVRSPISTVFLQVLSRFGILWGIVEPVSSIQNSWFILTLVLAWSLTEVPRYAFYALNLFSACPDFLRWMRYSLFIALYPMGIMSELLCIWNALPFIHSSKMWSLEMPNSLNFCFSYSVGVMLASLLYIPGSPFLYQYMLAQRSKNLGTQPHTKTA